MSHDWLGMKEAKLFLDLDLSAAFMVIIAQQPLIRTTLTSPQLLSNHLITACHSTKEAGGQDWTVPPEPKAC